MDEKQLINYLKIIADNERHPFQREEAVRDILNWFRQWSKNNVQTPTIVL